MYVEKWVVALLGLWMLFSLSQHGNAVSITVMLILSVVIFVRAWRAESRDSESKSSVVPFAQPPQPDRE